MGLDLGGPALEVAIGLAFVFFLLSLIVSGITEAFAWAKNLRGKQLIAGVRGMLGDSDVASKLLDHPLVRSDLGSTKPGRDPSYISPRNFALALADVVSGFDRETSLKEIERGIKRIGATSPLGRQLKAMLVGGADEIDEFVGATEKWFNDSMDRVSGWYKRHSQLIAIVAAAIVTVVLNASAVRVAERLLDEPSVRAAVVAKAESTADQGAAKSGGSGGGAEENTPEEAGEEVQEALDNLDSLKLPLLWGEASNPLHDPSATKILLALVGWLITAVAISLGAPFWFDALSKLAHLRTTGKKPAGEET